MSVKSRLANARVPRRYRGQRASARPILVAGPQAHIARKRAESTIKGGRISIPAQSTREDHTRRKGKQAARILHGLSAQTVSEEQQSIAGVFELRLAMVVTQWLLGSTGLAVRLSFGYS